MADEPEVKPAPEVKNRTIPPPGNTPPRIQQLFFAAAAVVIMILTGVAYLTSNNANEPRPRLIEQKEKPVEPASRLEIRRSEAEIGQNLKAAGVSDDELTTLLDERKKLYQSKDSFATTMRSGGGGGGGYSGEDRREQRQVNPIKADQEKLEYTSRFASLSYMNERETPKRSVKEDPGVSDPEPLLKESRGPGKVVEVDIDKKLVPGGHLILEGTILESVLVNRLDGSFTGPVNCLITTNVYSHNRQHLLIPQGSRVLGNADKVQEANQERLAVTFHRLIMPDGFSVDLNQFLGLDQQGASALKDKVNHHYLRRFGTSIALGLLGGLALQGTGSYLDADGSDQYRQSVTRQLGQDARQQFQQGLNAMPTITIREGTRVRIYISKDLNVPAYDEHPPIPGL